MTDPDPKPPTPFEQLGGVAGVRALVDRFYDLMDLEPGFADLRALHPSSLDGSRDKFSWFLCLSKSALILPALFRRSQPLPAYI